MKKVRFSQLVAKSGHPTSHLLLTDPKKDRTLQTAVKASRVLTVMQATTGTKTDWAEVGFHPGTGRQYLLFPKSLAAHAGKAVIGIKYDLLSENETAAPRSHRDPPAPKPPTKKSPARAKPRKAAKPPPAKEQEKKEAPVPRKAPPAPPKLRKASKPAPPPKKQDIPEVATLKRQIKRAMRALEKGQQVAAFNLLQKIVAD